MFVSKLVSGIMTLNRRVLIGIVLVLGVGISAGAYFLQKTLKSSGLATITGKVIDAETGDPIASAMITVNGKGVSTTSDGSYLLTVDVGSYTLLVSLTGYETELLSVDAKEEKTYTVNISLRSTGDAEVSWNSVNDFVYQLQNTDLTLIGNTKFDLVIIDYSEDGSDENIFTAEQINSLKNSSGGPKLVLAYMSIGEAENYRWYWDDNWDADNDGNPDSGAPSWLGPSNPEWLGNYKVKYWEMDWQSIIYGSSTSYLDKIIEAGFDGVYLDIIDAYEYWGPDDESGLNRETKEQEMVDFVMAIANYARITKGRINFGIFPQNGEALSKYSDYVQVVTGIGKEDTWYDDNVPQPSSYTSEVIINLDVFKQADKLVLVIDYVTDRNLMDDFYSKAKDYVPYASVRDLDMLTINLGHEPN